MYNACPKKKYLDSKGNNSRLDYTPTYLDMSNISLA